MSSRLSMSARLLMFVLLLSVLGSAPAAELPFEKANEFPAEAYRLIAEKRVVWFGELHGTRESPQLFFGLVKLVARHHTAPPVVALEIPSTEQAAIDRYLANGDESNLRSCDFFASELKDGRSSEAMVKLLSQLRGVKTAAVCCFDSSATTTPQERETAMAQNLERCAKKFPNSKLLVLSGNVHARVVEGTSWDPAYRPAAFQLAKKLGSVVSFNLAYEAGTMWAYTEKGFGEHKVRGDRWSGKARHYIALYPQPTGGHHGAIFTRTLTGSPPWK
jgi:erythromycin esterase-like protein